MSVLIDRQSFRSLARAMFLGFRRDGRAMFFTVLFPLIFLVVFGGVFGHASAPKVTIAQIGQVKLLDEAMKADARDGGLAKVVKLVTAKDQKTALDKVKKGDADLAVAEQDGQISIYYSGADQVKSGTAL